MPPRYAYWTILIDQKPTAFRAREREELLPTFHQLRRKSADVVMMWFARGRLWESPEAAQAAQRAPKPPLEKRGRDWRPGGEHRDPRDRFKKRSQPQAARPESTRDREKPNPRTSSGSRSDKPSSGPPRGDRPWRGKPTNPGPRRDRPADKPWSNRAGTKETGGAQPFRPAGKNSWKREQPPDRRGAEPVAPRSKPSEKE